eukprot:gb/GFBE01068174.1/.p1 GENE.gb/GFBE01068174.1/~~gb/GFBE01068174.1/.p1  ORF type:complete len:623 (+),score=141.17 gb/GFBE01068174.1/:1-1869(+)
MTSRHVTLPLPTLLNGTSPDTSLSPGTRKSRTLEQKTPKKFDSKVFTPSRVNSEISRRYDIDQSMIGSGACGKVYIAQDRAVRDRRVAIKKVVVSDGEKKKAFLAEAQVMKDLDHPNICKLLETYEQSRFMFFVMEYCEGGELFDRIMERGRIGESTTVDIARQAASALLYAHNRGIAHRDLKPENICFCNDDDYNTDVKLIDWGLAHYFGRSKMNSSVGSLVYAAPEVMEANDVDGYTASCDLWSLGVMIYVMLCGKPPFWGNFQEQLRRMRKEQFPMRDTTWQQISEDAKGLIRGLLKFDARQRMSIEDVLQCPWLRTGAQSGMDPAVAGRVLKHLRDFSNTSHFFSICVASVARQLDHHRLRDVHKVFREMDTNGDGVLQLHEMKSGFEKIFGANSKQTQDIEQMFRNLDLDGSGTIDYTEFCAAGIGERMILEEDALWVAFKTFDVQDDDGRVSKDEIKQVLSSGGVNQLWTQQVCQEVADEIFDQFDQNGDGTLDFQEWLKLMRECASRRKRKLHEESMEPEERELLAEFESSLQDGNPNEAYELLSKLDGVACRVQSGSTISTACPSRDNNFDLRAASDSAPCEGTVESFSGTSGALRWLKSLFKRQVTPNCPCMR